MSQPTIYNLGARIMHWAMALLLFSMIFAGLAMVQSLEPWHLTLLNLHKSFGVIALLAVILRLIIRLRFATPALPSSVPAMQKRIAHASHWLLYIAMFAMPLSGYFMQNAAGRPVTVFDLFTLPALMPVSLPLYGFFRELHSITAWALIALVLVHISAALHHGLVKRDGVLGRMTGSKKR